MSESELDFASAKDFRDNKRNRERLATLERRHDHLADRVDADPSLTFDASECAALRWAVRVLRKVIASGIEAARRNDEVRKDVQP